MSKRKTGQDTTCPSCGVTYYRKKYDVEHNKRKTCGKKECLSWLVSGERNPFWNKSHTKESKAKMSDSLRELGGDHLKGIKKTLSKSSEAQKERSERVRKSWVTSRDIRLESLPRGEEHHWKKSGHIRRHRVQFSPMQRREWKDEECAFCGVTENLVLDHILPISAGGSNERINAQTLCQPCNLWKMWFVDRPLALVVKGS